MWVAQHLLLKVANITHKVAHTTHKFKKNTGDFRLPCGASVCCSLFTAFAFLEMPETRIAISRLILLT